MKRFCALCCLMSLAAACSVEPTSETEPYVEPRIVGTSQMETENNCTLAALKLAIDSKTTNDIATLMEPISEDGRLVGYKIRYKQHGYQYVYLDILSPDYKYLPVSITWNDSIPYWTVDGEIFKDNGNSVYSAQQSGLLFQNRYGGFRFKYDSGDIYRLFCRDDEYLNLSIVKSVSHSDGCLQYVLNDGAVVSMDWQEDFDIIFTDSGPLRICGGTAIRVNFTTSGAGPSSEVTCRVSDGWKAEVVKISEKSGYVLVTAPAVIENEGQLTLILSDDGKSASRTVAIGKGSLETSLPEYQIDDEAQKIDIPVVADVYYEARVRQDCSSWLSLVTSTETDKITVAVESNDSKNARTGTIDFLDVAGNAFSFVNVCQSGVGSFCYEVSVAEFISSADNSEDYFVLRGSPSGMGSAGSLTLTDETGSVFVDGLSNYEKFASLINESVRLVLRGHKTTVGGEAVLSGGFIYNVIDRSHYSAHSWMELPGIDSTSSSLEFFHHPMTIDGVETRNYSFYYDYDNLVSRWVAYPLNGWLRGSGSRSDEWGLDPLLPRESQPVLLNPFCNFSCGFTCDRGHQCPSADRYQQQANIETFYGTNMTPQMGTMNQQLWAYFEGQVRAWSAMCDTLYVVTGCTVDDALGTAMDNDGKKVTVPGHYFKALLAYSKNPLFGHCGYKAAAFYLEHKRYSESNVQPSMAISVEDLESLTGIDFFVNLPAAVGDSLAETIEKENPSTGFWF